MRRVNWIDEYEIKIMNVNAMRGEWMKWQYDLCDEVYG